MDETTLKGLLDRGAALTDGQLAGACVPAWRLLADEAYAGPSLTLLCRAAKKAACREAMLATAQGGGALAGLLASPVAKQRKNAARLIGALGLKALDRPLAAALAQEQTHMVRPSMLLALGALGTEAARAALAEHRVPPVADETQRKHFAQETQALRTALAQGKGGASHAFTGLDRPWEAELRTHAGFGQALARELSDRGFAPYRVEADRVRVVTRDILPLYALRCFHELLFPLAQKLPATPQALGEPGQRLLALLRQCAPGEEPYRYRIELRPQSADRAQFLYAAAGLLEGEGLANAPSDYEAELRVERSGGTMDVYAKLYLLPDQRFAYRRHVLPAGIHPAAAGAIMAFARDELRPNARVLDPCCGGGTMLFEREQYMPCVALTGVDMAHRAVEYARQNALAAGSAAKFIVHDCLRFVARQPYDEVISNLPFGNRVSTHSNNEALYRGLALKLPQWLAPGGKALLYTMEYRLLENVLKPSPVLRVKHRLRTEAGGLMPYLFIVERK